MSTNANLGCNSETPVIMEGGLLGETHTLQSVEAEVEQTVKNMLQTLRDEPKPEPTDAIGATGYYGFGNSLYTQDPILQKKSAEVYKIMLARGIKK